MDRIKNFGRATFSSLKIRNYRLYFIGQAVSLSGTWMQTVALGWLVLELSGSGTQLGIVVALQFLPMLLLGPWGGLVADRYNKRAILYCTQVAFFVLALGISILIFAGGATMPILYAFALLFGVVRLFDNPARQTLVSELVDHAHLKNAVSLNATVNNLARAVGPSIAGVLIAGIGIAFCFFFNALTYVAAFITLLYMKGDTVHARAPKTRKKGELREGFRYVFATPLIRNTLIMMAFIGAFVFEFQVSLPILAQQVFHGDAKSYALLLAAMGAGSVLGGLFAAGRSTIAPHHLSMFMACFGVSLVAVALMPTLFLAACGMFVVGFFSINVTSLGNTIIQLESAPHMRGRVMALWGMAMMGSTPIGGPIIGFIGEFLGGRWGVGVGGAVALMTAAAAIVILRRNNVLQTISPAVESLLQTPYPSRGRRK
jgi:MFS family permease